MARDAQAAGYDVRVAAPKADKNAELKQNNITGYDIAVQAGGMNPFNELRAAADIYRVIRKSKPGIVQAIGIKAILPAAAASRFNGNVIPVYLFTGLGHVFTGNSFKLKFIRAFCVQY